jgi:photosystem II stability/assembly factor-like uncharacterized protein
VVANSIYGLGIFRSADGGRTWSRTSAVQEPFVDLSGYHAIVSNPVTGVLLAASTRGLLRSEDEGLTWAAVVADGNWTDVNWRPRSADSAFAVREYGGVHVSSDGGRTFQPVTAGLPPSASMGGFARIAPSASDSRIVYAGFSAADSSTLLGIYRSTDAGATWEVRATKPDLYDRHGYFANSLAVDPENPDRLFAGGLFLWRSTNGGAAWEHVPAHTQDDRVPIGYHAIAFHGDPGTLWFATDHGVFTSTGGEFALGRNDGLVTAQFYSVCLPAGGRNLAYGGTQDNGFLRYEGSTSWARTAIGGLGMECHCDPADPGYVIGELGWGYALVSGDSLRSFGAINEGLTGEARFYTPLEMDPTDPRRLFTATHDGIFRSTNGGALWRQVERGNDVVSLDVSPLSGRWVWALERSTSVVRVSRDGGDTWAAYPSTPFSVIGGTKILADPSDTLAATCAFLHHSIGGPLLMRTEDGGRTWRDVTGNLGVQSVNTLAIDPVRPLDWYAGTDLGVWTSANGGASWTRYGDGLPNAVVLDLDIQASTGTLWAATHGRGMWGIPTRSGGVPFLSDRTPLRLELASANPANSSIIFRFAAQGSTPATLRVYDVRGKLVAQVASSPSDGRLRMAAWSAVRAPKGIYFAELASGSRATTRKLVVVR